MRRNSVAEMSPGQIAFVITRGSLLRSCADHSIRSSDPPYLVCERSNIHGFRFLRRLSEKPVLNAARVFGCASGGCWQSHVFFPNISGGTDTIGPAVRKEIREFT